MSRKIHLGGLIAIMAIFALVGFIGLARAAPVSASTQTAVFSTAADVGVTVVIIDVTRTSAGQAFTIPVDSSGISDFGVTNITVSDRQFDAGNVATRAILAITGGTVLRPADIGFTAGKLVLPENPTVISIDRVLNGCALAPCSAEMVTNLGGGFAGTNVGIGQNVVSTTPARSNSSIGKAWIPSALLSATIGTIRSPVALTSTTSQASDPNPPGPNVDPAIRQADDQPLLMQNEEAENANSERGAGLGTSAQRWSLLAIGGIALSLVGLATLKFARR